VEQVAAVTDPAVSVVPEVELAETVHVEAPVPQEIHP